MTDKQLKELCLLAVIALDVTGQPLLNIPSATDIKKASTEHIIYDTGGNEQEIFTVTTDTCKFKIQHKLNSNAYNISSTLVSRSAKSKTYKKNLTVYI